MVDIADANSFRFSSESCDRMDWMPGGGWRSSGAVVFVAVTVVSCWVTFAEVEFA